MIIWIMLYMVIGLIYCGYAVTLVAQEMAEEKNYPVAALLLGTLILVVIATPLWPIWLGMGMAGNKKRART
ncbi:hypothetical protein M3661_17025 [Paenibacillus sp. MER 180]|uniref:hypothetical protein n=1 Tax=Paenibacillus sp. MER 180 TaxID=2939570 RepID=UPI002041A6AA|nr:hypothetical protein [Paenibacillus sp. MER 180]MCM3291835.1 hypothetical protein [Paenibacillus sp. MER 180]